MSRATTKTSKRLPYIKKAASSANPALRELYLIMEEKESNTVFCASFSTKAELLEHVRQVAKSACMIRIHIDMVVDFDIHLLIELQELSRKHRFLLFEDRKFAESAPFASEQYDKGIYKIAYWAHFVSAVPFYSTVEAIRSLGLQMGRGCLLYTPPTDYASFQQAQELIAQYKDFAVGALSSSLRTPLPDSFSLKEGVVLDENDYRLESTTPEKTIAQGFDAFIVPHTLLKEDKEAAAENIRLRGWKSHKERI